MNTIPTMSQSQTNRTVFPTLTGDLLSGGKATFPEYAKGQIALIVFVYEDQGNYQQAQNQSLIWQNYWRDNLAGQHIGFYEIPMIRSGYKFMSFLTDRWMRQGIPTNFHDKVVTVYGKKREIAEVLGIENIRDCFVCLVDEEGYIIETYSGVLNETQRQQIEYLISQEQS